jgi:hypothetical protein
VRTSATIRHHRLLSLSAVATVAFLLVLGLGLRSTTPSASQRPASVPAMGASAHDNVPHAIHATLTSTSIVIYSAYDSEEVCELEGALRVGTAIDDGIVTGYSCEYTGEPGPVDGPYLLLLIVETGDTCSNGVTTPGGALAPKVSPDTRVCG